MLTLRAGPTITAELVRAPDASVITLLISEQAVQQNVWRLRLVAEFRDRSRGHVGQLITRSQQNSLARPSRVIGVASCPGAIAWHVEASLVSTGSVRASAELGATVTAGGTTEAEVRPNSVNAYATDYRVRSGVGAVAPGTMVTVSAGERVIAVSAMRSAAAATGGTVSLAGQLLPVPPGSAVTVESGGKLLGPVTVTFTDVDGYVLETEV